MVSDRGSPRGVSPRRVTPKDLSSPPAPIGRAVAVRSGGRTFTFRVSPARPAVPLTVGALTDFPDPS